MDINYFFHYHPIFTGKELTQFLLSQGAGKKYAKGGAIKYYLKIGKIISFRRNCYAVFSPGETNQNFTVDYYALASKLADDSVMAYHTALELHGLAYSAFNRLTYLSHHHNRPFHFRESVFQAVPFPKTLIQKHKENFGTITVNRAGLDIQVTGIARTIVDVLDRPDLAGGWEEIWRSLDAVTTFDAKEAVDYALLLDNATTMAKLGFYLEQRPRLLAVDPKYINQLARRIPISPHYIERKAHRIKTAAKPQTKFLKKWNLIVPAEIVTRLWEEPSNVDI